MRLKSLGCCPLFFSILLEFSHSQMQVGAKKILLLDTVAKSVLYPKSVKVISFL